MKKAIIVGVNINNEENFEESFKELKGLAKACDLRVVGSLTQNLKTINKKTYIGPGKIESLKIFALEHEAEIIIFNNELSPLQYKNAQSSPRGNRIAESEGSGLHRNGISQKRKSYRVRPQ